MNTCLNDAFNNSGLPQFTLKNSINEFSKNDICTIKKRIHENDIYYLDGWAQSNTRKTLINFINEFCEIFRCYSLISK